MLGLLPMYAETPRSLALAPPMSDAELETVAIASECFRLERSREGEVLMNPPVGGFTSSGNAEVVFQLQSWWKTHRRGMVLDSNGTFFLADGSMLSPEASYILPDKLKGTRDELTGFPRLCPDFVIELLSKSDSVPKAQQKMQRWIENGVTLGWLIDPYKKRVYVYEPGSEVATVSSNDVRGRGPVDGFVFDLDELWSRYEI